MTDYQSEEYAKIIDCGDGVPVLSFRKTGDTGEVALDQIRDFDGGAVGTKEAIDQVVDALPAIPTLSARNAAVLATVMGQVAIGLAVILGANPIIGGAAAMAMMLTGIGLAIGTVIGTKQ